MIAVVTGAAGFIGSHMVDLLIAEGHEVRAVDKLAGKQSEALEAHKGNSRFSFFEQDLNELKPDSLAFQGAHWVFHFAGLTGVGPSIQRPTDYHSVNVMATVRTLEAARHAGVQKFVYTASSTCYGLNPPVPTPETAAIDLPDPYALSKWMGEHAALHWGRIYQLPVMAMRIFSCYGPRSQTRGAIEILMNQKLEGKPLTIVGDGTQRRDYVFVTDVVRAFLMAAASPLKQEILNIGTGTTQTVNRIAELLGGDKVYVPKRSGEQDCLWADATKIRQKLGWEPRVSFEEGIAIMRKHAEEKLKSSLK